jgi:tetratricopeptide (TPR) repeat protein
MTSLKEQSPDKCFDLGLNYLEKSDVISAIDEFTNTIRLNPNYAKAYIYRAMCYKADENYELCIADCNKVIQLKDLHDENNRTICNNEEGSYELITLTTESSQFDCYAAQGYEERSLCYAMQKNFELALNDIDRAISLYESSEDKERCYSLSIDIAIEAQGDKNAEDYIMHELEHADSRELLHKTAYFRLIENSKELDKKNKELENKSRALKIEILKKEKIQQNLEEKDKQLQDAKIELEDMMSMFAHKFRSPLDAIIYNTTHENQVKLYTEAAQTMRGLLNIFSIISTDAEILKEKVKQDHQGRGRLATVFSKTLDMILLHLLSMSGAEKIQQHYMAYAKAHGQCDAQVSYKIWCEEYFELEQVLQSAWEASYAQLINQSATLEHRLTWLEEHFFKLQLIGFERTDIQFKEYGVTESLLTILLNEILVNAFKYYSSASKQPVVLKWVEREGYQVLICRNPSVRSERTIIKGSHKGHVFLSTLARKTGSIFTKPTPQDSFVLEFGIPDELLISK